jgi:hypothetical protein
MSKDKRSIKLEQPPQEIVRGAQMMAEYLPQAVLQFCDNPLTEALPPALTPREVTEYLLQLPPYSDKDRKLTQEYRIQMTETAREFFVPNGKHLTVYYAIMNMIRRGYIRRNPVLWEYWKEIHRNIKSFLKAIKEKPFPNSRARGLAIVGSGGTGKSTTVEKILQSLPQVITHTSYKGQDFIMKQLVWLKLECPRNGSLRELCINFFIAVDEILGTQYKKKYAGNSHRTLEDLITGMSLVAANQCLGILVIDEIQDLSEARSGGDITMVNFFVHLENKIGVPFALIGTQDADPILSNQFRQLRRVSEQGYITWDRMSEVMPETDEFDEDEEETGPSTLDSSVATQGNDSENKGKEPVPDPVWKDFVETLWAYQYVKHPRPMKENFLEDKCVHALYKVSRGIPAVVQTIFVLTQQLAILNEEEKISPRLIRETVQTNLHKIKEMLGEARMKKPREIRPVSDLADMDDRIFEAEDYVNGSATRLSTNQSMNKTLSEVDESRPGAGDGQSTSNSVATKPKAEVDSMGSAGKPNTRNNNHNPKRAKSSKGDLPGPRARTAKKTQSKVASKKGKFSRPPQEYLKQK